VTMASFDAMHEQLSTNSRFAQTVTAQRRRGQRIECLRGCVFTEVGPRETRTTDVTNELDWWGLVLDRFGLSYRDLGTTDRHRLWSSVSDGHRAWVQAGRP
jgi:hypothetical protein